MGGNQQVGPAQNAAVARSQKDVQQLLESEQFKKAVAAALPRHMTPDRFIRVALTAMMRTPKLRQCTQESLFKCLLDCSALGIEPDGRRAHLIPYGTTCTLIIDYKGIAELVRRSGDVSNIHADVVYEKDEFDYSFGTGAFLKHKPNLDDRGENVRAYYSFVRLKDGAEDFIVMSKADVDKIRKRSKSSNDGPWVTDYDEMGKKTAFRRHSKWLPLSPELRDAIEKDDDVVDTRLADVPDGDPAWLDVGSARAAEDVAEHKIAQMRAQQQGQQDRAEAPAGQASPATGDRIYTPENLPDPFDLPAGTQVLYQQGDVLKRLEVSEEADEGPKWKLIEQVEAKPHAAERDTGMDQAAQGTFLADDAELKAQSKVDVPTTGRRSPSFGRRNDR